MDASQLAVTAVAAIVPWLSQVGGKALEKVQGQAVDAAAGAPARIFGWIKEKLATEPVGTAVVAALPAKPHDETNQQLVKLQLEKLLKNDESLRAELVKLLAEAKVPVPQVSQSINQSGDQNKATQIHGSHNSVTN